MKIPRLLRNTLVALAASAGLGTAVIGFAHTPWGRPLLSLPLLSALAARSGCPVGKIEPAAFENVRIARLRGEVGPDRAASPVALGFVLGQTHRAEVDAWIAGQDAQCQTDFVSSILRCDDLNLHDGSPEIQSLRLEFDAQARLVAVDLFRSNGEAGALFRHFENVGQQLAQQVGPATSVSGTPELAYVTAKSLRRVERTFRYSDYVAKATVMSYGKRGLRVREQYEWLPGGAAT